MFRRVTKVHLGGQRYKGDSLRELAKFNDLRELDLSMTSIPDSDLEAWKQDHPRVAVTVYGTHAELVNEEPTVIAATVASAIKNRFMTISFAKPRG